MIQILKGESSIWGLQVFELAKGEDYLFLFKNLQTLEETVLYINSTAQSDRYTRFEITDPTDFDLEIGEYEYTVFDGDGVSVDYSEMTVLETGKLIVK